MSEVWEKDGNDSMRTNTEKAHAALQEHQKTLEAGGRIFKLKPKDEYVEGILSYSMDPRAFEEAYRDIVGGIEALFAKNEEASIRILQEKYRPAPPSS